MNKFFKGALVGLLIAAGLLSSAGIAFAGGSNLLVGKLLPASTDYRPVTGKMWVATRSSDITSSPTFTYSGTTPYTGYYSNVGNFSPSWTNGETVVAIVEKADGRYSVTNLTLNGAASTQNFPDATFQAVPTPTATGASGAVNVAWSAVVDSGSGNIAGYNVYRDTNASGSFTTKVNGAVVAGTSFSDTSAAAGTTYYYKIKLVFRGSPNQVESTVASPASNGATPTALTFNYSLGVNPASGSVAQGSSTSATVSATLTSGTTQAISLTASGQPAGVTVGFSPASVSPTATSTMSISVGSSVTPGVYAITISGTGGKTAVWNLTVTTGGPTITRLEKTSNPGVSISSANAYDGISAVGTNYGASKGSNTVTVNGVAASVYYWSDTKIDFQVPNTTSGNVVVTVNGVASNGMPLTINSVTTPTLVSVSPNTGAQGTTNLPVQIVGANTSWSGNMASSIQISGTGVTLVNATATSGNAISATLAIASDATLGIHNITVTGASGSVAFTVTSGGNPQPTAIIIDDFEGGCVGKWATQADGGYYTFGDGMMTPNNNLITGNGPVAEAAKNGALGMKVQYSYVPNADPTKDWGDGWGAQLKTVKDLSTMKSVTMNMRWDGSTNAIKFGFQDSQGHVYVASIPNSALMAVTTYGKLSIPLSSFAEDTTNPSRTVGAIDWAHITNYNFAYLNKGTTTNYQFIDDITALTTDEVNPQPGDAPVISSISPSQAPTGTTIIVAGLRFGTAQGMSTLNFTNNSTGTSYPATNIISWTDTSITARVPSLAPVGTYEVVVNKLASSQGVVTVQQSNQQPFQVTSSGIDTVKAYPNPFDPNHEIVNLVFNPPAGTANVGVYIYDMTARLVSHTPVGTATQTTWNGKDQSGYTVGDGAYLVRVVNEDTKSLIAKGKILVVKH